MNTPIGPIKTLPNKSTSLNGMRPSVAGIQLMPTLTGNAQSKDFRGTEPDVIKSKQTADMYKRNFFGVKHSDHTEPQSFKKGGMVTKTNTYKLHKGEMVIPKKAVDKMITKHWRLSDGGAMKN